MITKTLHDGSSKQFFIGRVLEVDQVTETRNCSDTMDYSDFRTVNAIYALVWLGTEGVKPHGGVSGRRNTYMEPTSWSKVETLDIIDQFAWVDCTNTFADLNGFSLFPVADTFDMQLLHGGPLMLDNLATWKVLVAARRDALLAELAAQKAEDDAAEAARNAAAAKRAATAAAKLEASRAAANEDFKKIPAKGTTATVDGVTGKVFWTGVTKYRGSFAARYGVKNERGEVAWGKVG